MKKYFIGLLFILAIHAAAQRPLEIGKITTTRETPVHDPVMIKEKDTYYIFCTGYGISVFSSKDMQNWRREKPVFDAAPEWAVKSVPGFKGHIWAPDISYHIGRYYLYYATSAFGKNTSCIGLAINKTLDTSSADFKWQDMGKVIQSVPGRDMWNAIDANLIIDDANTAWLTFGSFWNGIKMVKLSPDLLTVAEPQEWHTIARRPRDFSSPDSSAGNAAIEAPFIFKKGNYYYLFVSQDYCCRAEKSNYKVVLGRSEKVTGPYLDKTGKSMFMDGGSIVVEGNKDWFGAGHNAVYHFDGIDYNIYHGYDAMDKGRSKLRIQKMQWDGDGWPIVQEP